MLKNIPEKYIKFNKLVICSNTLLNTESIIGTSENAILLIGNGVSPIIWLWVYKENELIPIIEHNIVIDASLLFVKTEENKTKLLFDGNIVIDAIKNSESSAEINYLNLKPLGFNIYGDQNGLNIGGNFLQNNTVSDCSGLIGISPPQPTKENKRIRGKINRRKQKK